MRHISGPSGTDTKRYIVNADPMDAAKIVFPPYISQRQDLGGYGNKVWIVSCGGAKIQKGIAAVLAVYPNATVFADRQRALHQARRC